MESKSYGMGFIGWLQLAFIILKLTDYIDWSWWWVLSPLWLGIPVIVVMVLLVFMLAVIGDGINKK